MHRILIRDLKRFLLFTLILMAPLYVFWSSHNREEIFPVAVFVQLSFSLIVIILTVMLNEQYEDTHNGYRFYHMLPIKRCHVLALKFLIPLIAVMCLAFINRLIYTVFPVSRGALKIADSVSAVAFMILALGSVVTFILIYLFGYNRFMRLTSGLVGGVVLGSFVLARFIKFDNTSLARFAENVEQWLIRGNPVPFLIGGAVLYGLLYVLANVFEKR